MKSLLIGLVLMVSSLAIAQAPAPPTMVKPTHNTSHRAKAAALPAGSHSAQLAWTQSTSTGVTGNNVYRSQTHGGPYNKVATFTTPTTSDTDGPLAPVTTYFWVVTATCSTCNPTESVFSNEVTGTTLPDGQPNPATGLTLVSIN